MLVVREESDWMFLCGEEHEEDPENYRVVGFGHLLKDNPCLLELVDLSDNYEAERADVNSDWLITKIGEPN